jgi:type II secretory pathway pseudopilin PulG
MTRPLAHPLRRGFTLLEVVVALSMAMALSAAALGVLLVANQNVNDGRVRAQMNRDAQLLIDAFEHDVRYLGLGVPSGTCQDGLCAGQSMVPTVRVAQPQSFVFLGDLPYPNAEFSGVMQVAEDNGSDEDRFVVTSELGGDCRPYDTGAGFIARIGMACDSRDRTMLNLPNAAGVGQACTSGNPMTRTCPWGLNKVEAGSGNVARLMFIGSSGNFWERCHSGDFAVAGAGGGVMVVGSTFVTAGLYGPQFSTTGANCAGPDITGLSGEIGPTTVLVQPDRVFWVAHERGAPNTACTSDCVVVRRQCWGGLGDMAGADFPDFSNAQYDVSVTPSDCGATAPADGTGWEVYGEDISSFTFSYYLSTGATASATTVADATDIRGVTIAFTLERTAPSGQVFVQRYDRTFFLENADNL